VFCLRRFNPVPMGQAQPDRAGMSIKRREGHAAIYPSCPIALWLLFPVHRLLSQVVGFPHFQTGDE